ncbi:MAG: threonine/serine exporter family protein [Clostridia bacterium]|nr:threonine/serine exporter family protein [Clostridia bacterium]
MITVSLIFQWIIAFIVSSIASCAFAVIFHSPRNQIIPAGIVGGVGWVVYIILGYFGIGVVWSSFYATLTLAYFARTLSFVRKCPATVFLVTGIFPLVPGLGIYNTGYSLFMNSNSGTTLHLGLQTVEVAVAIALGMGLVLTLPGVLFYKGKKKT